MDLIDANSRVVIAFGIAMITALLTYIAFFKESKTSKKSQKSIMEKDKESLDHGPEVVLPTTIPPIEKGHRRWGLVIGGGVAVALAALGVALFPEFRRPVVAFTGLLIGVIMFQGVSRKLHSGRSTQIASIVPGGGFGASISLSLFGGS